MFSYSLYAMKIYLHDLYINQPIICIWLEVWLREMSLIVNQCNDIMPQSEHHCPFIVS